jgi:uncharacterized protein (TIGR01777 family)
MSRRPIVVTGATGLIGRALISALRDRGDPVVALARDPDRAAQRLGSGVDVFAWPDPATAPPPPQALRGAGAVVNLLGEPVAQRWSAPAKRRIRDSRVEGTRRLIEGLAGLGAEDRPAVLVAGSAIGYYGSRGQTPLEETAEPGRDFLAGVVVEWEAQAAAARELMRVVLPRTGVVLARSGGALAQMLPVFRLGLGGPVAGGHQYVSWIQLDDEVGALLHCLDRESLEGPVNLTAPEPVTNRQFAWALGRALRRPAILPVPAVSLRLLYGEMAQIVVGGQRVLPTRLQSSGYQFRYPEIAGALAAAVGT